MKKKINQNKMKHLLLPEVKFENGPIFSLSSITHGIIKSFLRQTRKAGWPQISLVE